MLHPWNKKRNFFEKEQSENKNEYLEIKNKMAGKNSIKKLRNTVNEIL